MKKQMNSHVGSPFESWLDEQGIAQQLTAEEEASFDESLAQAERGEFATDDEVRAIWAKHGL